MPTPSQPRRTEEKPSVLAGISAGLLGGLLLGLVSGAVAASFGVSPIPAWLVFGPAVAGAVLGYCNLARGVSVLGGAVALFLSLLSGLGIMRVTADQVATDSSIVHNWLYAVFVLGVIGGLALLLLA